MNKNWTGRLPLYGYDFSVGLSVTLMVAQASAVWIIVCGVSTPSFVMSLMAVATGCIAFGLLASSTRGASNGTASAATLWMASAILLGLFMALPSTLHAALKYGAALFSEQPWLCFAVPGCVALVLTMSVCWWQRQMKTLCSGRMSGAFTAGAVTGLLLPLAHAAAIFPAATPVAAALLTSVVLWHLTTRTTTNRPLPTDSVSQPSVTSLRRSLNLQPITAAIGLGVFIHAGTRLVAALMPISLPLLLLATAFTAVALFFITLPRVLDFQQRLGFVIATLSLPVFILIGFDGIVNWNLSLNATVDSVSILYAARSLQLASLWIIGLMIFKAAMSANERPLAIQAHWVPAALIGVAAAKLLSSSGCAVTTCLAAGLTGMIVPQFLPSRRSDIKTDQLTRATAPSRILSSVAVISLVLTAVIPFNASSATQLLFNARSSQGFRAGLDVDVIRQSSPTRLLSETNSTAGQLTAWRTSGDQLQLRRDGIPVGQISSNTATSPQPIADVLPAILPLVMHQNASSLLLIGDDTGAALRACSEFPVHTVVAIRPDDAATEFATQFAWQSMPISPLDDDRIHIRTEPVALAVRRHLAASEQFDAIVAVSPNPICLNSPEQLTPQFYRSVRNQLTDNGVFCQRITRHDIGAQPLVRLVFSISHHFARVVMLHMAEGEIAIVAGVQADSLLDAGLLTRMQRDHVSRALSHSGWDWSQVAALPAIDTNDPVGIFEHQSRLAAATAANVHFAHALPLEAAAWTDKSGELREIFAPHQQRMADAAQRGPGYDEFARRYSAVVQQSEILATFPDQPWPYRRSLRTEMQRNPRPPVKRVNNGKVQRVADRRDSLRKDYFTTLGNALQQAKSGTVDPLALRELTQFTARYEPLLSYFAHHELVRIHEAAGHPSPALELRHRLHTVFFTEGGDFSVRQITSTIQQILDDPELVTDTSMRFDYVNSMLQELVRRWELRRNYEPGSARQTQHEVDTSVAVAKRALDALQEWSTAAGVTTDDVVARRRFINKGLISPLRTYHEQVLAHRMKHEAPAVHDFNSDSGDLPMMLDPTEVLGN